MKINRVEIDNFMAIGEVTVDLDSKGLVLVQGENDDDTSQNSNGSGKSTVAEALCWGLYNQTARDQSGDDVVNRKEGKNCRVLVQLVDGDRTYNVIRHRKHKDNKNRVLLFDVTDHLNVVDLTLGTDKLTDERIEKLVGCSGDVFRAAIYSGQEAQIDLPSLTDKHLKTIVEEAAGINKMQDAYTIARSRLSDAQAELMVAQRDIQEQENLINVFNNQLATHELNKVKYDNDRIEGIETSKKQLIDLVAEVKVLKARADAIDEVGLLAEKNIIDARLRSVDGERTEQARLQSAVFSAQNDVKNADAVVKSVSERAKRLKHNLDHVGDSVGSTCDECGHIIGEDDVEPKREAARNALTSLVSEMRSAKATLEEKNAAKDAADAALAAFKPTDVTEATARLSDINKSLSERSSLSNAVLNKTNQAKMLKASIEAENVNPHVALIEDAKANIEKVKSTLNDLASKKDAASQKVILQGSVVEVFSPAGIRAQILDTVTPFLNERTAKYLGVLSDGNISAVWSTLSRTAKGELRERFEIAVSSSTGASSYKGLSGGEKKKVRLSTALALQDLVSSRASKPIQLWIGDEIDDAVDVSGLERLMTVLEEKAKEKGTVMIISHNSIRDWVRQHVTVKKVDGKATMTGVLCIDREVAGV